MGFGMHNSSMRPRGDPLNANLKGDCEITTFVNAAGLNVQNFPQYLAGLVAQGYSLGALTNDEWEQILGPMELGGGRIQRVHKAISDLRMRATREADKREEKALHNHLVNGGAHPASMGPRRGGEVYEPELNGASKINRDYEQFVAVPFFQGEKAGWTFKHGEEGLGYYKMKAVASPYGAGGGAGPVVTSHAVGPGSRGYNPVSQAGLEQRVQSQQYLRATQTREKQLLSERRQRMEAQRALGVRGF